MTVDELRAALADLPSDLPVWLHTEPWEGGQGELERVEVNGFGRVELGSL